MKRVMSLKYYLKLIIISVGMVIGAVAFVFLFAFSHSSHLTQGEPLFWENLLQLFLTAILFMSSVSLVFGAFVESKKWLCVWALGTFTYLLGYVVWLLRKKYSPGDAHPESVREPLVMLMFGCFMFVMFLLIVIKYILLLLRNEQYLRQVCAEKDSVEVKYTPAKQTYLHSHPASYILKLEEDKRLS